MRNWPRPIEVFGRHKRKQQTDAKISTHSLFIACRAFVDDGMQTKACAQGRIPNAIIGEYCANDFTDACSEICTSRKKRGCSDPTPLRANNVYRYHRAGGHPLQTQLRRLWQKVSSGDNGQWCLLY